MEPLGQSQVMQYVYALAKYGHQITVLSFEKPDALADENKIINIRNQCMAARINWQPRTWHNKPIGILATIYDLIGGCNAALRIVKSSESQVVHCRSYISGIIGITVKKVTGTRFIFDMRGFWPDERVDGGIWKRTELIYRIFKNIEKILLLNADHVVSLTRAGVRELSAFEYLKECLPPVSVIPTCTNLDYFKPVKVPHDGFTLGYVGSAGSWYMFEFVALAVKRLFEIMEKARFLVINKGGHAYIENHLKSINIDMSRVEIRESSYDQVALQIARMDAGIFFIKPVWSKKASCPTKMGEFLACGKPCLTNEGVGDVHEDLAETRTGITVPVTSDGRINTDKLDNAIKSLISIASEPDIAERCRSAAIERFSLIKGVAEYDRIYNIYKNTVIEGA